MTRLSIPRAIYKQVIAHALTEAPSECCGFLVGREKIERVVPLRNTLASQVAYNVDAKELLRINRELRAEGFDVLAVYHSHPTSTPVPSASDLAQNGYGETVPHLIIGLRGAVPEMRAWWLGETSYREAEWCITD
jgi:proteasome lid subunit RPN8/RPN11